MAQALAAISSQLSLTQKLGPFNVTAGGSRSQYAGRDLVNQDFPNFSVTAQPINLASWLAWTPTLSVDNNQAFNLDNSAVSATTRFRQGCCRQHGGEGEHAQRPPRTFRRRCASAASC